MATSTIKNNTAKSIRYLYNGYREGNNDYTFTLNNHETAYITVKTSNGNVGPNVWLVSRYGENIGISPLYIGWDALTCTSNGNNITVHSTYGYTLTVVKM